MTILYYSSADSTAMLAELRRRLPERAVVTLGDDYNPLDVTLSVVWQPPAHCFDGLANLSHVFALAAGVDQLLLHPGLDQHVQVVRLLDAGMAAPMAEYVLYGALHAQRGWSELAASRALHQWNRTVQSPAAPEFTVGILGAGTLGAAVAQRCRSNGYSVRTWSRSHKLLDGVESFAGTSELAAFLAPVDVLACLLPLTPATAGILCTRLFSQLPKGAFLINAARGDHLIETDLTTALDEGQLSGALLDVFSTEPLPPEHRFWADRRILITPHIAAPSPVQASIDQIAANIRRLDEGKSLSGCVDRQLGY